MERGRADHYEDDGGEHEHSPLLRRRELLAGHGSERITYGEMQGEGILERHIEIMACAVGIRGVEPIAEVGANHHHPDIDAEADTGAEGDVA